LARALLQAQAKPDKAAGLDMLLDLAKDGYPAAMWRIGASYYSGRTIKKDARAAAFWFRQAADKGLGIAMSDLAYLYENGDGVAKDRPRRPAGSNARQPPGYPGGMRNYALFLDQGEAVPRNPRQSAEYLITAFRMGSEDARESLLNRHEHWQPTPRAGAAPAEGFRFYNGRLDGSFDAATFSALEALQSSNPIKTGR